MTTKEQHPCFIAPENENIPVWRYMDFTKFVSLLENQGLYFARADKLGDPFEGSFSRGNESLRTQIYKNHNNKVPLEKCFNEMRKLVHWTRQWTMINCWHMNESESAGMWKLYAKTNEAISIQTTFCKLKGVISERCYIGVVNYIDYTSEWMPEGNTFYPFVHKRKSFAHEKEVRCIFQNLPTQGEDFDRSKEQTQYGEWEKIDLSKLIENIYVAPTAPEWFYQLTKEVTHRYFTSDYPKSNQPNVKKSSLDDEPFF